MIADRDSAKPDLVTAQVRIFVPREPKVGFDFFADLRNEPQYNQQVSGIRKIARADRPRYHVRWTASRPRAGYVASLRVRTSEPRRCRGSRR